MEGEEEEEKEKQQILMDSGCMIYTCRMNLMSKKEEGRKRSRSSINYMNYYY